MIKSEIKVWCVNNGPVNRTVNAADLIDFVRDQGATESDIAYLTSALPENNPNTFLRHSALVLNNGTRIVRYA